MLHSLRKLYLATGNQLSRPRTEWKVVVIVRGDRMINKNALRNSAGIMVSDRL